LREGKREIGKKGEMEIITFLYGSSNKDRILVCFLLLACI
jgi:hypothetical protein